MRHAQPVLIFALFLVGISPVAGQYNPVDGAEDFVDLYSPRLLAEGAPVAFGTGPQSDVLNPATSALVQRTTLDASYVGLTGFGDRSTDDGWQGHVVNLGLVSPSKAAVFSGSFHIVSSTLAGMGLGTSGWLHGSAAKELYPGWLVGAGMRLGGGFGDSFDVGVAVDLGMLRTVGAVGALENVLWGVSLQNLGKWYAPFDGFGQIPSAFTPAAGVSFTAFSNDWARVETAGTVSVPGFRNLRAGLSGKVTLFDAFALHLGWKLDLRQLIDPAIANRSLIPSFGLSGSFRTGLAEEGFVSERGWTETEIRAQTAAAQLYNGIWAFAGGINAPLGIIDTAGPQVTITYPEPVYISPNNDGTKDSLTIPIGIEDERFVMGWWFEVADSSGVVRTLRNKDDRPENAGFQSVVDRITAVQAGVQVPESIRWDGTADTGEIVDDGRFRFRLSAVDDNGNVGTSGWFEVYVDATSPDIVLLAAGEGDRVISPNGDGNKDTFEISHTASVEELWTGGIVNSLGNVVRTYSWTASAPEDIVWQGETDSGEPVPDGVYQYEVRSVDAAGNSAVANLSNIIVNTEATPVSLQVSSGYFSPNRDGLLDTITMTPVVPAVDGIVGWELVISDARGAVWTVSETGTTPEPVEWRGQDENQSVVGEGEYRARLKVSYRNGNAPEAESPAFVVDVTPPSAAVQADRSLFSPNGDGRLDSVTLFQETSREERWVGSVSDRAGRVIRQIVWPGVADQQFAWNGRQDDGRLASDGTYAYTLESTDLAGNRVVSEPVELVIDTSETEIGLTAEFDAFSPNADGVQDRQRLSIRVDRLNDVREYSVSIIDDRGASVRTFEGRTTVQPSIIWDGTRSNGRRVADGTYRATLEVTFLNGIELNAGTGEFRVDTAAPSITVTTPFLLFSPDGDGARETIRIVQTSSFEDQWTAAISDMNDAVIREFVWTGRVGPVDWDGRDPAGNVVPDGRYSYRVSASDRAGNSASAVVTGLTVDTRQPRLFVTTSTPAFSPNDDGARDTFAFDLYANLLDGATGWRLTIRASDGLVVREFTGTEVVEAWTIAWDGRDGRGNVREGTFSAEFGVDYEKGNRPVASSGQFRVDVSAPVVSVRLSPLPFSPDNDGVNDELLISPVIQDSSPILAWSMEIFDRNDRFFNEFTGRGSPASRIVWDGRAADGDLVISAEDYPYVFTVRDELGNTSVTEGVIPVDILVIRDGDRLKVQISSITFAPNSPNLIVDPEDARGAKNRAILLRLGEIFDKYSSYSIRIEGHAVNLSGTDAEERDELQPLSLSRAQAVKDAMVDLGISERRISVIGRGGTEPLVPHDDTENRWKNRRVEFVLIR